MKCLVIIIVESDIFKRKIMKTEVFKQKWILSDDFDTIRINGIPFLERGIENTDESKKVMLLASKSCEMLSLLHESIGTFICQDSVDKDLKNKILNLIEQFEE